MDLRLLRYFTVVADELHITRAAARLGIQQAPLSQQIKRLEYEIGAQLLRRKPRGVELTDAGIALRAGALAILANVDEAITLTQRVARGEQGEIRIGLTTSACFHPFPPQAIRKFRRAHEKVVVQFEQNSTPGLIERLCEGRIDVAFIRTAITCPDGIRIVPVLEEPMVVALPSGHRLTGQGASRISLKSLANEWFIGYPRSAGIGLYDAVIASCIANGFSPNIAYEAPQIVSTLNLVAAGMGVSVVPESMQRLRLDDVVYRPMAGPGQPSGHLNLAIRADGGSAAEAFVQIVNQAGRKKAKSPASFAASRR